MNEHPRALFQITKEEGYDVDRYLLFILNSHPLSQSLEEVTPGRDKETSSMKTQISFLFYTIAPLVARDGVNFSEVNSRLFVC